MLDPVLNFVQLEVTAQCNVQCVHCYTESGPRTKLQNGLTLQDFKDIATDARSLGAHRIQLIGGEPALWPGTPELLHHAKRLGFDEIEYYSNLTLLPDKVANALRDVRARIAVTLLSHDPDVHDALARKGGSWSATVKHIQQLVQTNQIRVSVVQFPETETATVETVRFAQSLGVSAVHVDRVRSIGRARLEGQEATISLTLGKQRDTEVLASELCGRCTSGMAYVSSSGAVHFCGMSREITLGTVKEHALGEILRSDRFLDHFRRLAASFQARELTYAGSATCTPTGNPRCSPEDRTPDCSPVIGSPRCGPENQCHPVINCSPRCGPY